MKHSSPKEVFNNYAEQYQAKFMDFSLYHDTFDVFCDVIKTKNASILEVGCGPGNISKYLLAKRPDFKLTGIDIASKMLLLAKQNNPSATFKNLDCKDILQLKTKFEAISCGFTLPYLNKQEALQFIDDASKLLQPNGIIYLSTMEDDYKNSKIISPSNATEIGLFTYYHQADYLIERLELNDFKIIQIYRKEYPEKKDTSMDLILIASKSTPAKV